MIRALLLRLRDDRRGVATIEFALMTVLFFFVMTAGLDLAMWYQQRLRLDSAVEQGAMLAFNSRSSVDAPAVKTYVAAAAKLATAPVVTVGCNGGTTTASCVNSGRSYVCLSGSGASAVFTPNADGLDKPCADGSLSGYYLTIKAVATGNTMLVPAAMLGGTMTQTRNSVVRLE